MRRAMLAFAAMVLGCGGTGSHHDPMMEHLEPSRVLLTQARFTPAPERPSWLGGFSEDDFWFAPFTGGVLRSQKQGLPARVDELEQAHVGGPLTAPGFLPSGDAFFTVLGAQGSKLVHWKDGQVDDETAALVGSPAAFDRIAAAHLTPSGEYVVLVRDASNLRHVTFFSWSGDHFAAGPSFDVPADLVTVQMAPVSSHEAMVIGADQNGLYRIARFDGTTLSAAIPAPGQLSGPFLPTGADAGFISAGGMSFWNGTALMSVPPPPVSPVYLAFDPDGLASIDSDGSPTGYANPRIVLQHAAHAATRYATGDESTASSRHWLAAGVVGSSLLVMLNGNGAAEPSVVAVTLGP